MIYLDNSATSFYKPESVKKAIIDGLENYTANAGRGAYDVARNTSLMILDTRDNCRQLFNVDYDVILTPSCSFSLNLAIRGIAKQNSHFITTYLEHNSVLRTLEHLKNEGKIDYTIIYDLTAEGLKRAIKENTIAFVSTHISNVTGEKLDIKTLSKICRENKIMYILDTAQSAGHIDDEFSCADIIAFAGHKGLKGLIGVGGLMIKNGIELNPIMFGGTGTSSIDLNQPSDIPEGFEVGSLPAINILSLNAGIDYCLKNKMEIIDKRKNLTSYLIKKLDELNVQIYGNRNNNFGVISFNIADLDSGVVSDFLNENYGICTRSGLHCAPLVHKFYKTTNQGMIRVSIDENNSFSDIDKLSDAIKEIKKSYL